jgi:hypothetical protein
MPKAAPARDLLADVAEPHDADGLALQLVETRLGEVADPPLAVHAVPVLPGQLLEGGQDQHDRVLGHRHRVGAAVVGDRHPGLARSLQVERVVAGADELDELEFGGGGRSRPRSPRANPMKYSASCMARANSGALRSSTSRS